MTHLPISTPPISTPLPPSARGRFASIDALRGIAILAVLLYHVWMLCGSASAHWWNPVSGGYIGVDLFLMLSGFCLYWPFVNGRSAAPTLGQFARRRAWRILPPFYVALALCALGGWLWPGHLQRATFTDVLWHLSLLHNLRPDQVWIINGPFWSLALEVNLYVAFPVLVFVARRYGIGAAVAVAVAVSLVYRTWLDGFIGGDAGWNRAGIEFAFVLCYSLPGKWFEFALGMLAASLAASPPILLRSALSRPLLMASCVLLLSAGMAVSEFCGKFSPFAEPCFAFGLFALLVFCLSSPSADSPRFTAVKALTQVVQWRPLVWIGTISFSIYLVHLPLLKAVHASIHPRGPHVHAQTLAAMFVFLPVVVAISYLFHLIAERPFMGNLPRLANGQVLTPKEKVSLEEQNPARRV